MSRKVRLRKRVPLRVALMVIVPLLGLVMAVGVCFAYTAYSVERVDRQRETAEREADRRWCSLLNLILRPGPGPEPPTEMQVEYARLIAELRSGFGCR